MIAVASRAADEGFPVVVEGFDTPGRRVVLAEGDDFGQVCEERVAQLAHGDVVSTGAASSAKCCCRRRD